jgi:hypothetical protein
MKLLQAQEEMIGYADSGCGDQALHIKPGAEFVVGHGCGFMPVTSQTTTDSTYKLVYAVVIQRFEDKQQYGLSA